MILSSDKKKDYLKKTSFYYSGCLSFSGSGIVGNLVSFLKEFIDNIFPRVIRFGSNYSIYLQKFKRIIFLQIAQFVWLFIFSVVLEAEPVNSFGEVSLRTREFDSFRRIILTISRSVDTVAVNDKIIIPELNFNSQMGDFEIILSPIDTSFYVGKTLCIEEGAYPVRLLSVFPDSITVIIKGKTTPFEKIIGYNVIGTNQFIFDIYKNLPPQADFLEKTVMINSESQDSNTRRRILEQENTGVYDATYPEAGLTQRAEGKGHFKMAFLISIFVILIVVFVSLILIFMPKFSVIKNWFSILRKGRIGDELVEEDNIPKRKLSSKDKQVAIGRLMKKKGVSYDEADIMVNISKRSINVTI